MCATLYRSTRLLPLDADWPQPLTRSPSPPSQLHVRGSIPCLDRAVAIVGTRRASLDALDLAHTIASDLARAGCPIVSGGAEGVDAAAHRGALSAGGVTVAVMAGGVDRPFPRKHESLLIEIEGTGAVLSEQPNGTEPRKHLFLLRNRLIAAAARAVLVIQAPERSGALSTARHARVIDVPVFAVPWGPLDPLGEGSNRLLVAGARAVLSAADLLTALGEPSVPVARSKAEPRSELERAILAAIHRGAGDLDTLVGVTGRPLSDVSSALAEMELEGRVAVDLFGLYRPRGGK